MQKAHNDENGSRCGYLIKQDNTGNVYSVIFIQPQWSQKGAKPG